MKLYSRIGRQIGVSYLTIVLNFIISPLFIVILSRALSVAEYGIFSILTVTASVASVVFNLGIPEYVLAKLPGLKDNERISRFFSLYFFEFVFLLILFGLILSTGLGDFALKSLKLDQYPSEFIVMIVVVIFIALIRMLTFYFNSKKQLELGNFVFFCSVNIWVIILTAAYFIYPALTLQEVVLYWLYGHFATLLICFFFSKKDFFKFLFIRGFNFSFVEEGLAFSTPLILFNISFWLVEISDRYLINFFLGHESVGIYSLLSSLLGVIATFGTITINSFIPYIASAWNQKKEYSHYINYALRYSLMMVLPGLSIMFFFGAEIITLFSGTKFISALELIPYLLATPILIILNYILYQIMLFRGKTKTLSTVYLVGALVNILLNLVLIPAMKLQGAAISKVISLVILLGLLYILGSNYIKIRFSKIRLFQILIPSIIAGSLFWVHPEATLNKILVLVFSGLIYSVSLFLFKAVTKEEISSLLSLLRTKKV